MSCFKNIWRSIYDEYDITCTLNPFMHQKAVYSVHYIPLPYTTKNITGQWECLKHLIYPKHSFDICDCVFDLCLKFIKFQYSLEHCDFKAHWFRSLYVKLFPFHTMTFWGEIVKWLSLMHSKLSREILFAKIQVIKRDLYEFLMLFKYHIAK